MFDMQIETKGGDYKFSNILREEFDSLYEFLTNKGLPVSTVVYFIIILCCFFKKKIKKEGKMITELTFFKNNNNNNGIGRCRRYGRNWRSRGRI